MEVITICLSVVASLISGLALFFLQRFFKRKEKIEAEREKIVAKEKILIFKSIDAVGKMTYANALAIKDGKHNGEMKDAIDNFIVIKDELMNYLLENNAKK